MLNFCIDKNNNFVYIFAWFSTKKRKRKKPLKEYGMEFWVKYGMSLWKNWHILQDHIYFGYRNHDLMIEAGFQK